MKSNYFDKQFRLRFFEMNQNGVASPSTILTILEETAADHCYHIDHSLYDLKAKNIGWVLLSGIMKMERYPNYKERITVRTWLSEYSGIRGIRENLILDESGKIIGRAKGLWVFFDIERRRPLPILNDIKERWAVVDEDSIAHNIKTKIPPVGHNNPALEFQVKRFDTDMNKHVNNIRYLQWVMESLPEEIVENYQMQSIDGRFMAEANYGETVKTYIDKKDDKLTFHHTIKSGETDRICATALTTWRRNRV